LQIDTIEDSDLGVGYLWVLTPKVGTYVVAGVGFEPTTFGL